MRFWQIAWRNIRDFSQGHPHQFIEALMLLLAIILLILWGYAQKWPYLVLSLSYSIGSSSSTLVRESYLSSRQPSLTQLVAVTLLIISFLAFVSLI